MSTNLISYVIPCHGVGRSSRNAQTRFLHHLANKVLVTSKTHLCNLCKNQVARHCERQCHHGDWEGRRRKKWRFKIIISSVSLCGNGGNYGWITERVSARADKEREINVLIDFFTGLPLPQIILSFCPASTLCWLLWSSSPLEPVDTSGLCRSWDRGEAARAAHTSLSLRLGLENTRQLHTWPPVTIGNKQTAN